MSESESEIPTNSNLLVLRTEVEDHNRNKHFPAEEGFSPTLWFLLGKFGDEHRRGRNNFDFYEDYLALNGYGSEETFQPYLNDDRTFDDSVMGPIYTSTPYNDSGHYPGLLAISGTRNPDNGDNYNFGKDGVVYMWTYLYVPGESTITINIGSNADTQHELWLNGNFLHSGNKFKQWYTTNNVDLNPGFNLILLKIGGKHLAGQILLFSSESSEQLGGFYSVWPTLEDLS